jgi:Nucleotide-diphospho-sugar transferase
MDLVVYCFDADVQETLRREHDIESRLLPSTSTSDPDSNQIVYGTQAFKMICFEKLRVIADALNTADVVMWLDGDVIVRADFTTVLGNIAQFMEGSDVPIVMQCDCPDQCRGRECWMCAGVMILRRTPTIVKMLTEVPLEIMTSDEYEHDQDYVNWFCGTQGVRRGMLPRDRFPNGVFVNAGAIPSNAVLVHYNHMVGDEKMRRMKENGHWIASDA